MVKAGPKSGTTAPGASDTKARIVDAAIETLKRVGFNGASARAIAATGGFNQALIFYHFGSMNALLLAALDETSARRLDRYRGEVESATTLPDLIATAARIYLEDLESGHIKVLAELIAAASASPELGPEIAARVAPWTAFAQEAIDRVLAGSPLRDLIPSRELAQTVVALYLGMELLTHLEGGRSPMDALFERASALAPMFGPLLGLGG